MKAIKKSDYTEFQVVHRTKAGTNGRNMKVNQDIEIIEQKLPFGIKLFCVCDGHGVNGHHVAAFIKKKMIGTLCF
jgi:serine/threonine protein phosphatase PrpC